MTRKTSNIITGKEMFKNVDYSDRNKTFGKRPMQRQESEFWKMSNDKNHNFRTLF